MTDLEKTGGGASSFIGEKKGIRKGEREATLKMGISHQSVWEKTGLTEDDLAQIRHSSFSPGFPRCPSAYTGGLGGIMH